VAIDPVPEGGSSMNIRFTAAAVAACLILISQSPLKAQDQPYGSLTRIEKRTYHACLYAHWIDGYCRFDAWGATNWTFRDCVIANGACECPENWGPDIADACRVLYQSRRR
jgi:hypothetical protein